jgi:hypothetical protein
MADRSIELLNELLKIFNQEEGEYLNLVGDFKATTPVLSGNVKINDFNIGAIANVLEHARQLTPYLTQQIDLTQANDFWLDYIGENVYDIKRAGGESDADYSNRIIKEILGSNSSPLVIKNILEDYGDNVLILEGIDDGAFSEVSFSDNYRDFELPGEDVVKAAFASAQGGIAFFFRVIMENVDPNDYKIIWQIVDKIKAAGVSFVIQID